MRWTVRSIFWRPSDSRGAIPTNPPPFSESLRTTLTRTLSIALVVGGIVALATGRLQRWPAFSTLTLWPAFGGHWIELLFLNGIRPHIAHGRALLGLTRIVVWFVGGMVLAAGVQWTARLLFDQRLGWLGWTTGGAIFVGLELVVHAILQLRGKPNFYNGLG